MKTLLAALAVLLLAGCTGDANFAGLIGADKAADAPAPAVEAPAETTEPTPVIISAAEAEEARVYLSQLSPMIVRRELNAQELSDLKAYGKNAIRPILEQWSTGSELEAAARSLIEEKLSVNGTRDGVDFNLPGNLAAYVVRNSLPWKTVLTADYCVDGAGNQIACDSGAPYTAGVLTTRAFLMSRASRFNLARAGTMLKAFACKEYPLESALQPNLDKSVLIPLFAASNEAEQTDPRAAGGFGNGTGCYMCHSQFGAHAQLFVKFDQTGMYRADADGQQNPSGELGRSVNGLYTSHMKDPIAAKSEASQMFGIQVSNLRDAAWVLANSKEFTACQVKNLLQFTTGIHAATYVSPKVLAEVTQAATQNGAVQPTFGALVYHTFSHPRVIEAVTAGAGGVP